ncbi:hypothetical protein A7D00_2970 [Trichophyton violaceum]|uniref:Uncharacterized protein n=1 Tax=Trichophyton violaceum TaxID=34388 RepID=A0A178FNX3_TRIVO|nr:hypothetical protein A7D00_2970 [Trichophyton violaceum]
MRGISPVNTPTGGRSSVPYAVSPVSSIRHHNVLDTGQAYSFQNAESGSMVQYGGAQKRDTGVVEVEGIQYSYDMDSRERLKVRNMLERQKKAGKTSVEIGKYLLQTYNNRDQGLGGIVTYLFGNGHPYVSITAIVMKAVGLNPPVQKGYRAESAYATPAPSRPSPNSHALLKYEASSRAGTLAQGTVNLNYVFEDGEEPPFLRPATLERIQRGYFDPKLDWGRK